VPLEFAFKVFFERNVFVFETLLGKVWVFGPIGIFLFSAGNTPWQFSHPMRFIHAYLFFSDNSERYEPMHPRAN